MTSAPSDTVQRSFQRRYLTDDVARHLEQLITTGRLGDGQQLPPEPQLASDLGVSRTVVREALHRLKQKGLLVSRAGHGTFITRPTAEVLSNLIDLMAKVEGCSLPELRETRRAIEVAVASSAATRCTPAAAEALAAHVRSMEAAQDDPEAFVAADSAFHLELAIVTQNRLLALLEHAMLQLMGHLRPHEWQTVVWPQAIGDHRAVLDAVRAGDAARASEAMANHLDRVAGALETGVSRSSQLQP
jgi:DNA-binding FadR family transcriptional regulator